MKALQKYGIKGPNGPWKFLLILTPEWTHLGSLNSVHLVAEWRQQVEYGPLETSKFKYIHFITNMPSYGTVISEISM